MQKVSTVSDFIPYSLSIKSLLTFLSVFLICISTQISQTQAQFYNNDVGNKQEVLQKFVGQWYQLGYYSTLEGQTTTSKGTTNGEVIFSGSVAKLQSIQGNQISVNESLILLGFDSNIGKYYLQGYDRSGNLPTTFLGDYDNKSQKFTFETMMLDEDGNKVPATLELWFERDDKFIYKTTISEHNKKTVISEIANMKVENKDIKESKKKKK